MIWVPAGATPDECEDWLPWMRLSHQVEELGVENLTECGGYYELTSLLNATRVDAIRMLLRGQSMTDLRDFESKLLEFGKNGYGLSDLNVRLRCPSQEDALKIWTWEICPAESKSRETGDL